MPFSSSNAEKSSPRHNDTDSIITTTITMRSKNHPDSEDTNENSNAASYLGLFGGTASVGPSHRNEGDLSGAVGDDVSALSGSYYNDEDVICESSSIKVRATNAAIHPKTKASFRNSGGNGSGFFRTSGSSGFYRAVSKNNNPSQISFPSDRIYGRDQEMAILEGALAKTATIDRQLILLEGTAGAGKTSLAHQLRHTVHTDGGFFLGGKYDQSTNQSTRTPDSSTKSGYSSGRIDEPYAAVTMACRDLCDALLTHKEDEILRQQQQIESNAENGNAASMSNTHGNSNSGSVANFPFTFEEFQRKLQAELEPAVVHVLTTVFPDLTQILGGNFLSDDLSSSDGSDIGYNEAQQQFKYAIRRLLRVLCSFGRVVLFLDDCQWADAASLDLLKNIITDCRVNLVVKEESVEPSSVRETQTALVESKGADATPAKATANETGLTDSDTSPAENGLLVLVAYRSEDVYEKHPLLRAIDEIKAETTKDESVSSSVDISKLTVDHLSLEQVNELLFDILAADFLQETMSLAECIYRKTEGNILYVIQFLKTLSSESQENPLLKYNFRKSKWEWDVVEIRMHESATQNVVQMIQQKLENLQEGVRLLLPVVGLLGASFAYPVFERVLEHFNKIFQLDSSSSAKVALRETSGALLPEEFLAVCDEEGVLIFDNRNQQIRWDHDKIQEAAIDLVSELELSKLRIRLGRFLMESFSKEDQDENVFILINLLDGINYEIPSSESNRLFLAELNWKAGSKAFRANAHTSAAVYLDRGIVLLPENHWYNHYNLSLDLYSTAAEAQFCTGQLTEANNRCEEIRAQMGSPKLDMQRANTVSLDVMNARGQTLLAQDECIKVLSELGCTFPKHGHGLRTIGSLLKLGMTVKSLDEKISTLSVMTDPTKKWVMRLLDRLITFTYQNKSDMFGLVVMKSFHYTLKYGSCDFTPPCICTVGMMLGGILGDYDAMNRFGELALEQYNSSQITRSTYPRAAMIAYVFNCTLHKSTYENRDKLLECYKEGMASGDVESSLWAIMTYLETGLILGLPLKLLEKDLHAYTQQMADLKQEIVGIPCMGLWQAVSNLLGHSDKWSDLEKVFSKRLESIFGACDPSEQTQTLGHHYRETNAFYCGDYEKVLSIMKNYDCDKVLFCSFSLPTIHFRRAIAAFVVFRKTKNKKHKKLALQESKITKGLSKWGNPCLKHYVSFVAAEKEALQRKNFEVAVKLYEKTIHLASDKRIVHDQALANERLGDLFLCHNEQKKALRHFQEASKLYLKWGSSERSNVVLSFGDRQALQGPMILEGSQNTPTQRVSDGVFVLSEEH